VPCFNKTTIFFQGKLQENEVFYETEQLLLQGDYFKNILKPLKNNAFLECSPGLIKTVIVSRLERKLK